MKSILGNRSYYLKFCLSFFLFISVTSVVFSQSVIRFGNSYINVSKKTVGGTVQPGDTLEIRTSYYFPNTYNGGNIYFTRYYDNIPSNTVYAGDSLRLITNEGLLYKRWTNGIADDAGSYVAIPAPLEFNIRINIGTGVAAPVNNTTASANGGGRIQPGTSRPRVSVGSLITTAFKVRVTGAVGDSITLGAGEFRYKKVNNILNADTVVLMTRYKILISNNDPMCSNALGKNFAAEAGGTFDSGTTQNRSYGPTFPIPAYTLTPITSGGPSIGDGLYTIVNNTSPWASTFVNAEKRNNCVTAPGGPPPVPVACANRMFAGHWDIMGDHTGQTTSASNPPKAAGAMGGYMLVVNADVVASEAYRQTINGLCGNTSYEFSAWVKNICTNCGIDSTPASTWKPGVLPNLTFAIDGLDRYSTGQLDTVGWLKKGFLFKTGPAQTSITISIRNNCDGGGGNDWALDDIKLGTCNPGITMTPSSGSTSVCLGNPVDISSTVRAFFNNYVEYRWEKSIDNGVTWTVANTGTGSPTLVGGQYEYTAPYPTFIADSASNWDQYKFVVASSAPNLADNNCNFLASTTIIVMVNGCWEVLKTKLLNFKGSIKNGNANLLWIADNEVPNTKYEIERSTDKINFIKVGTVHGKERQGSSSNYNFEDNLPVNGNVYYRLKIIEGNLSNYSKIVLVGNTLEYSIRSLINPFRNNLSFDLITPEDGTVNIVLVDPYGKIIKREKQMVTRGLNSQSINNLGNIQLGIYTLQIEMSGKTIIKRVIKLNE